MSTCRACNAPIRWIVTKAGKKMPVNPNPVFIQTGVPDPDTTIVTDQGQVLRGKQLSPETTGPYVRGYITHFATCPEAKKPRKPKEPEQYGTLFVLKGGK